MSKIIISNNAIADNTFLAKEVGANGKTVCLYKASCKIPEFKGNRKLYGSSDRGPFSQCASTNIMFETNLDYIADGCEDDRLMQIWNGRIVVLERFRFCGLVDYTKFHPFAVNDMKEAMEFSDYTKSITTEEIENGTILNIDWSCGRSDSGARKMFCEHVSNEGGNDYYNLYVLEEIEF